jgi:hypothetical protein
MSLRAFFGTAKAVPFQSPTYATSSRNKSVEVCGFPPIAGKKQWMGHGAFELHPALVHCVRFRSVSDFGTPTQCMVAVALLESADTVVNFSAPLF